MEHIIYTKNLTKEYKRFEKEAGLKGSIKSLFDRQFTVKTAVGSFDMEIEEGEFVGLIGPNGAGKTTLVNLLTGIIAPTNGDISVMGYYPNTLENEFKKQYAVVMGQKSQLFFELTPQDTFGLFKELYEIPDSEYKHNVDYFVDLFGVSQFLNVQVRTLSLGERMKMELIVALLHNPRVLFLDEPTIGLDAVAQRQMRSFLKEVNRDKGTTILLTSHYMEDVRSLCSRSIVVNDGHKLYDGDTDRLFDAYQSHKKITVMLEKHSAFIAPKGAEVLEENEHKVVLLVPKECTSDMLAAIMQDFHPQDISVEEEDIGNVVERIYAGGAYA
ncbi:MAG: ATP-binding cassette domain-containing protein [Clostridiales bacterium]|nr:ATP-binding cassette domain-containing protein [Clostridiales bacterium]